MRYELATAADDAEVRRLLRDNPLAGAIEIALQREPDAALAAAIQGDVHQLVVAREAAGGRLVGLGGRSVMDAWLNGRPARLGYLSQLRIERDLRARTRMALHGFGRLAELHADGQARLYVTTIAADDLPARRLLEAGLPGFPSYVPVDALQTLLIPTRDARPDGRVERGGPDSLDEIVGCLARHGPRWQFARRWSRADLLSAERCRDLAPADFLLARREGALAGCLAVWDQRRFKQAVVRGEELPLAYVSHLALAEEDGETLALLLGAARADAARRGCELLVVGLSGKNPLLAAARRAFPHRAYASQLYAVHWEDGAEALAGLDGRTSHVEVALL